MREYENSVRRMRNSDNENFAVNKSNIIDEKRLYAEFHSGGYTQTI